MTIQINITGVNFSRQVIVARHFINIILQKFFDETIAKKYIVSVGSSRKADFISIHPIIYSKFNKFSFLPQILLHDIMNHSIFPFSPSSRFLLRSDIILQKTISEINLLTKKVEYPSVPPIDFSIIVRHYKY